MFHYFKRDDIVEVKEQNIKCKSIYKFLEIIKYHSEAQYTSDLNGRKYKKILKVCTE